ncbi:hypothetical protein NMY22_g20111 [Coprinellus aureogranulatus]|nr:hypothetical protein NMY22_g20111 [Coprinellus aureogranulatus]
MRSLPSPTPNPKLLVGVKRGTTHLEGDVATLTSANEATPATSIVHEVPSMPSVSTQAQQNAATLPVGDPVGPLPTQPEMHGASGPPPQTELTSLIAQADASSRNTFGFIQRLSTKTSPCGDVFASASTPKTTKEQFNVSSPRNPSFMSHKPQTSSPLRESYTNSLHVGGSPSSLRHSFEVKTYKAPQAKRLPELVKLKLPRSRFHLYTYRNPSPSTVPSPDIEVLLQQGRRVEGHYTFNMMTFGHIFPRPKGYQETGCERYESYRDPVTRIWKKIPVTHYSPDLPPAYGNSCIVDLKTTYEEAVVLISDKRKELGLDDVPVPDSEDSDTGESDYDMLDDAGSEGSDADVGRPQFPKEWWKIDLSGTSGSSTLGEDVEMNEPEDDKDSEQRQD